MRSIAASSALVLSLAMAEAALAQGPAAADDLLRDADLFLMAPRSFRTVLEVTPEDGSAPTRLEVRQLGHERSLVRFDDGSAASRCLVRNPAGTWLVTPGARRPVKLPAAGARGAASLAQVLSSRYSQDFSVQERIAEADGRVRYELRSTTGTGRVRYVVDPRTRRPVRIEALLPSGRTSLSVEILAWHDGERPSLARVRTCEPVTGGPCAVAELRALEPTEVPEAAFDAEAVAASGCRSAP